MPYKCIVLGLDYMLTMAGPLKVRLIMRHVLDSASYKVRIG